MDDQLKRFLESQDERYWTETVRRLTYEAIRMLTRYGFGGGNYAERAAEYAVDAVSEAWIRAAHEASTKFDIGRGDQTRPVDDRFWTYLVFNCLRPLITRDAEKWKSRARWPQIPLEEVDGHEIDAPEGAESEARAVIDELIESATGEVHRLLVAARAQFEEEPNRTEVNWKAIQRSLGITRYACDKLRRDLDSLRIRFLSSKKTSLLPSQKR